MYMHKYQFKGEMTKLQTKLGGKLELPKSIFSK